jgi:hypothetical protein
LFIVSRTVVHYLSKYLLPETALPKALECREQFLEESAAPPPPGSSPPLRLVTFNILARAYAQSSHALSTLYDYLADPDMHLSEDFRLQLVVKELLAYR